MENDLKVEDCLGLIEGSVGLRHVAGKARAEGEMRDGSYGDALALGSCYRLIAGHDSALMKRADTAIGVINQLEKYEIDKWIADFSSVVKKFIGDCLNLDLMGKVDERKDALEAVIGKILKEQPCFLLGRFNNGDNGYETDNYYGLGKCGGQPIAPQALTSYSTVERSDFADFHIPLESPASGSNIKALEEFIVEKIFGKIVELIKKSS